MIAITPYLSADKLGEHQDKLVDLYRADSALSQTAPDSIKPSMKWLVLLVNSFYSNKIEGNSTQPNDFLLAQEIDSSAPNKKPTGEIVELLAHIKAQINIQNTPTTTANICKEQFIRSIHRALYKSLSEEHLIVKNTDGSKASNKDEKLVLVKPGDYRIHTVKVGSHVPPKTAEIKAYMNWIENMFNLEKIHGRNQLIASAALHHRLAWIHPFQDGNGRAIRLLTDCYLRHSKLSGSTLWSLTRGFALNRKKYYKSLAEADKPRQGATDGRGVLSDSGLLFFTKFFIDTALEQIQFFSNLIEPKQIGNRVTQYFESRPQHKLPITHGNERTPPNILAKNIYLLLLEKGAMSQPAIGQHLGKKEQTLSPLIRQMNSEGLISAEPEQDIKLNISANSIPFLFPGIW